MESDTGSLGLDLEPEGQSLCVQPRPVAVPESWAGQRAQSMPQASP